ncbi:MAG: hypothetical protein ACYS0G_06385 [Planctomycetota bacterium]|jgi:hypothetical protein
MHKISIVLFLGVGLLAGSLLWRPLLASAETPDVWSGTDPLVANALGLVADAVGPSQAPTIVGSWLADIVIVPDVPALDAQAVLNFSLGGGLTIVDTTDMGGHPISAGFDAVGYGAWEHDGDTVKLRYVLFNYKLVEEFNDDTGEFNTVGTLRGYTRITDTVELIGPDFDYALGTYSIETFGLDEDPLGPPQDDPFTGTFTMRRITVD